MTVDTKLRDAASSVRRARMDAEFTVADPSRSRKRIGGWPLAALVGSVAVLLVGVPALVTTADRGRVDTGAEGQITEVAEPAAEDAGVATTVAVADEVHDGALADAPGDFPYLAVLAPGWYPTYAVGSSEGGYSAEINYEQTTEDGSGGLIVLRIQTEAPFDRFAELASLSASSENVDVAGRAMTLYFIPHDAIPEDTDSDAYLASWSEGGASGYAIGFGLARGEFVDAIAALEPISAEAWMELILVHSVATTTTSVEPVNDEDTP